MYADYMYLHVYNHLATYVLIKFTVRHWRAYKGKPVQNVFQKSSELHAHVCGSAFDYSLHIKIAT